MDKVPFDDPSEFLYIRVKDEHVDGENVLSAAVAIPDWSTNRQRFSNPEDVLVGYDPPYSKVAEFTVGSIPPRIKPPKPMPGQTQPKVWLFWAEHDPLPDNTAHSEVRMKAEGTEYRRGDKPQSKTYKKAIRMQLARILRVRA